MEFSFTAESNRVVLFGPSGAVGSHKILLKQKHVFALSASGEKKISKFSDLAVSGMKIAVGNVLKNDVTN